jgi:hypothetical protein
VFVTSLRGEEGGEARETHKEQGEKGEMEKGREGRREKEGVGKGETVCARGERQGNVNVRSKVVQVYYDSV